MTVTARLSFANSSQTQSNCLSRDSPRIRDNKDLRRRRKTLLCELSSLVKTGKALESLHQNTFRMESEPLAQDAIEDMMNNAFRIVVCGAKFLDTLYQHNLQESADASEQRCNTPSTWTNSTSQTSVPQGNDAPSRRVSTASHTRSVSATPAVASRRLSHRRTSAVYSPTLNSSSVRHMSFQLKPAQENRDNYVSERLTACHVDLTLYLETLISRLNLASTTLDLFLILREAVDAGKSLYAVIEALCEHNVHSEEQQLREVGIEMYNIINELIAASHYCSRPLSGDHDEFMVPRDHRLLLQLATQLVAVAGLCVAEARLAIEETGDFELDPIGSGYQSPANIEDANVQESTESLPPQPESRPPQPPVEVSTEERPVTPPPQLAADIVDDINVTMIRLDSPVEPIISEDAASTPRPSERVTLPTNRQIRLQSFNFGHSFTQSLSESLGGRDTAMSRRHSRQSQHDESNRSSTIQSMRDSEQSLMSQASFSSTRATTPDVAHLVPTTDEAPKECFSVAKHKSNLSTSAASSAGSHSTVDNDVAEVEAKLGETSYAHELVYTDGQVSGGSLAALIEILTADGRIPDPVFVSSFYLTFRMFVSPTDFAQALVERYDSSKDKCVHLRVINVMKSWIESNWRHFEDEIAIPVIEQFAQTQLQSDLPQAGTRLMELTAKVSCTDAPLVPRLVSSIGKTSAAASRYIPTDAPLPPHELSKSHLASLTQWKNGGACPNLLDMPPVELARQMSIKAMSIFGAIMPHELLECEWQKTSGSKAHNVKAMATLANDLGSLVVNSVLAESEPKKRATVIKHWIKIVAELYKLNNFHSLTAIATSLQCSAIIRLRKTWGLISEKKKEQLDEVNALIGFERNHVAMRQHLQNVVPPCVPYLGMYLTDLVMCNDGNPTKKQLAGGKQIVNFYKYTTTAKIIGELQRFQVAYRLQEVEVCQEWLQCLIVKERSGLCYDDPGKQFERSLEIEPRENNGSVSAGGSGSWGRGQVERTASQGLMDLFSWRRERGVNESKLSLTSTNSR